MADEERDKAQVKWKNTHTTFLRQFTIIEGLIARAKTSLNKLEDPEDDTKVTDVRLQIEPIEHKLGLIKKYIDKLWEILPDAAPSAEDNEWSVEALSVKLELCMQRHTDGTKELKAFIDAIELWELTNVKEAKPVGRRGAGAVGGDPPEGGGTERQPEIKGVATTLKPEELTVSIQAHEMTAWREQWAAFRDNSAFSTHGDAAVLAYLRQCVSREILLAVNYREKRTEEELLEAIQEYLDTKIHPKVIRQLEI